MAFFTPSLSPAVVTREIDLTGIVPNVATSTGVFVGNFRWGPVEEPTEVDNEARLVSLFASPDTNNTVDFHTAAYFLRAPGDDPVHPRRITIGASRAASPGDAAGRYSKPSTSANIASATQQYQ